MEGTGHRLPQQRHERKGMVCGTQYFDKDILPLGKEIFSSAATELVPAVSAPQPSAAFVELPPLPERQTAGGVVATASRLEKAKRTSIRVQTRM